MNYNSISNNINLEKVEISISSIIKELSSLDLSATRNKDYILLLHSIQKTRKIKLFEKV